MPGMMPPGVSIATLAAIMPIEPETEAYVARFTTPPTPLRKLAINHVIYALKACGAWSKLDACYLLTAADSQAASLNLVSTSYTLTAAVPPTFVADYGEQGSAGTSQALNTNLAQNAATNYTQNSASLGVYALSDLDQNQDDIGAQNATIRGRYQNSFQLRINQATTTAIAMPAQAQNSTGLTWVSRDDATNCRYGKDAVTTGAFTAASVALTAATFLICGGRVTSDPNSSSRVIGAALFGSSLTNVQWAAISRALDAYMNLVARPSGFFH